MSRATVSYAFSRPDQLSDGLRRKILEVADELGSAGPNPTARSLRLGRAGALGLVFSETLAYAFADPYAIGFLQGLATAAENAGRLPVIVVDEPYVPGHPFLGIDEPAAGAAAARHVIELGHRRLRVAMVGLNDDGHIGWAGQERQQKSAYEAMRRRRSGYQSACEEAGIDWSGVPFYELARNSRSAGHRAGHALLAREPRPTAILTNTDVLALGVLDAAAEPGLRVPEATAPPPPKPASGPQPLRPLLGSATATPLSLVCVRSW